MRKVGRSSIFGMMSSQIGLAITIGLIHFPSLLSSNEQNETDWLQLASHNFFEEKSEEPKTEIINVPLCEEKKWYFELKPAYFYFLDSEMRSFFSDGGFTIRAETGYKFWGPLIVWADGGYFQKTGSSIGGSHHLEIKLATITLGLKIVHSFNRYISAYVGAAPRLFLLMLDNDSPYVRGTDNEIGIGGGFDAGFWIFPIPNWPNFFIDAFADISWKNMKVDPDEISSGDSDVNLNSLSTGIGVGFRF